MPTTQGTPASRRPRCSPRPASGRVKSTVDVGLHGGSPHELVSLPPRAPAPAREPTLPPRPYEQDLHAAAGSGSPGCTGSTAARNRSSLGPIAGRGELLRREQHAGELGHARRLHGVDLRDHAVEREQLLSVMSDLPSLLMRFDVDSMREHDAALEILLRALELGVAHVAGGDVGDLLGDDREAGARFSSRVPM